MNSLQQTPKPDAFNPFAVCISLENIKHITKAMIKKEKEIKSLDPSYSNLMDSVNFIDKYLVKVFSPKKRSLETIYYLFSSFTQQTVNYNKEYLRHPDLIKSSPSEQKKEQVKNHIMKTLLLENISLLPFRLPDQPSSFLEILQGQRVSFISRS